MLWPVRDDEVAEPEDERGRGDEAVAAGPPALGEDREAADGDAGEEERRHPADDAGRECDDGGAEAAGDAGEDHEHAASVAGATGGAASKRNDADVLGEEHRRRRGGEGREDAPDAVGCEAALHPRVGVGAVDVDPRDFGRGDDVAETADERGQAAGQQRQDEAAAKAERERVGPDEGAPRRGFDGRVVDVASGAANDGADAEADGHGAVADERRSPDLDGQDRHVDQEAEAEEFGVAPGQRVRGICVGSEVSSPGRGAFARD